MGCRRCAYCCGMAKHSVTVTAPPQSIDRADVKITITADGKKLGDLTVSRGSIDWKPARWRKHNATPLKWEQFDAIMRAADKGALVIE